LKIPILIDKDNIYYYPISYVSEKILLRKGSLLNNKERRKKFKEYLQFQYIDYGWDTGGLHETLCISEEGLKLLLQDLKLGRMDKKQKENLNLLLEHLRLPLVDTKERFKNNITNKELKQHNKFVQHSINEVLQKEQLVTYQKCTKCNKYYPHTKDFFSSSVYMKNNVGTICKKCNSGNNISIEDKNLDYIYKKYGEKAYFDCLSDNIKIILNYYQRTKDKKFLKYIESKENYIKIIKLLYQEGKITKDNLTQDYLKNEIGIYNINNYINIEEIYQCLFGNHHREYPWHYKNYMFNNMTFDEAKIIFNNYLKENNIIINDIFNFDYSDVCYKCRLKTKILKDILSFVVKYYDYKYPGYKFNIKSVNYWDNKENRIRDLKYLIEKDFKIPIEKIPLYLTLTSIRNIGTNTLYNVLKKYYKSLFDWVNECYPNRFIPTDFNINYSRKEFDSMEEQQIDDLLNHRFKSVYYNHRENNEAIKINGMIPDWIVFTDNHCWLIEYFGLYVFDKDSRRVKDYVEKTKDKIKKYRKLRNYKYLFLFPNDLKNNFKYLAKKFDRIH